MANDKPSLESLYAGSESSKPSLEELYSGQKNQTPTMLDEAVAQKQAAAVQGIKRGIIGGLGFPGDVTQFIGGQLGLEDKDRALPTSEEVAGAGEKYLGIKRPEGKSEKVLEFASNPLSYFGGGSLLSKILGAIGGGTGADIGERVGGSTGEIVGGVLGGVTGASLRGTPKTLASTPANRQAAANVLTKEGVTDFSAGAQTGSGTLRRTESMTGQAPFSGSVAVEKYNNSLRQFTRAALRRVGMDSDVATREVVDKAFTNIGSEFDRLQANTLAIDQTLKDDIAKAWQDYKNTTEPGRQVPWAKQFADTFEKSPTSIGVSGENYKSLRSELDRYRRGTTSPEYKDILQDYINALDGAMERTLQVTNPADVGKWRAVRRAYRNMLVIEKSRPAGELGAEGVIRRPSYAKRRIR